MSGLLAHQDRLDVVSDNISNANTVAFKRSRVAFSEVLGQQLIGVGRTQGGNSVNPAFVGNGVNVGSIDKNWNQGKLNHTDIRTDLALNGDGYFVAGKDGRNVLTRAGNFSFDQNGVLVTSTGLPVQGYGLDADGNIDPTRLQTIQLDSNTNDPAKFTENATLTGNLSADAVDGDTFELSTAVVDEQGKTHNVTIEFTKTGTSNEWEYEIGYGGDGDNPFDGGPVSGTIGFETDGSLDPSSNPNPTLDWNNGFVGGGESITFDIASLTQFSGSSTALVEDQDGHDSGELVGYNFNSEGMLELNFSNGEQQIRGQLAIGEVNNPNGLEQIGDNLYGVTAQSGDLKLGRAGQEISTSVVAGALEESNVDIATEFTDMITTQRGYQASARVITTSDEILQETLQLKR